MSNKIGIVVAVMTLLLSMAANVGMDSYRDGTVDTEIQTIKLELESRKQYLAVLRDLSSRVTTLETNEITRDSVINKILEKQEAMEDRLVETEITAAETMTVLTAATEAITKQTEATTKLTEQVIRLEEKIKK